VLIGHSTGGFLVQKYLEDRSAPAGVLLASTPPQGTLRAAMRIWFHHPWLAIPSRIRTQVYATSVLTTLRNALTKLETSGYAAGSIVLHPSDWEGVELALPSTNAVEHLSLPYDPPAVGCSVCPVVATISQAAGVGHVLAQDAVVVDTDTIGVGVQWSENSNDTDFSKNLIRAR
jgi:hypothetical protein